MKLSKSLIVLLVFILLVGSVSALCPPDCIPLVLSDGTNVNRTLSFDNTQAYVDGSEQITINGLILNDTYGRTNIFFDGKTHPESKFRYLSMNDQTKELIISSTNNKSDNPYGPSVIFTGDNPFVKIEQNDFFSVKLLKGAQIYIQNRDEQNLIPKVIIKEIYSAEDDHQVTAILINGIFDSEFEKGNFSDMQESNNMNGKTPTPLSVSYADSNGDNYLRTNESDQKIIFSNFNERALVRSDATEGWSVTSEEYDYAPSLVSEALSVNSQQFSTDQLRAKYPSLNIEGNTDSVSLKRLSNTLNHLPPALSNAVRTIHLWNDTQFIDAGEPDTTACYVDKNGDMYLRISSMEETNIYHEMIHVYFHNYERVVGLDKLNQKLLDVWEKIDELEAKDPNDPQLEKLYSQVGKLSDEYESKQNDNPLKKEWLLVVGGTNAYGDKVVEKYEGFTVWKDVPDKNSTAAVDPKNGFIRSYSATSLDEDIATFVEHIYKNPDFYKPLITLGSTQYDRRYLQKLDLLQKYGLITAESYEQITGHPVIEKKPADHTRLIIFGILAGIILIMLIMIYIHNRKK